MKHSKSFVTCLCQLFDALRQLSIVHHHTGIEKFVVHAYREIETVKAAVASARSDVDALHLHVYEQTLEKSQTINVAESAPRVASRQQHRQTTYYKCTLTIPVLDHLSSERTTSALN